jgi:hypothetical protein
MNPISESSAAIIRNCHPEARVSGREICWLLSPSKREGNQQIPHPAFLGRERQLDRGGVRDDNFL